MGTTESLTKEQLFAMRDTKNKNRLREWKAIELKIKNKLKEARAQWNRAQRFAKGSQQYEDAQKNFTGALNDYLEFYHTTRGYEAALKIEAQENSWFVKNAGLIAKGALLASVAAVGFMAAAVIEAHGGIGAISTMGALAKAKLFPILASIGVSLTAGLGANKLTYEFFKWGISKNDIKNAETVRDANHTHGGSYQEMRNSEPGKILAQRAKATRYGRVAQFATSFIGSWAGILTFHHTNGTELLQRLGFQDGGSFAGAEDHKVIADAGKTIKTYFLGVLAAIYQQVSHVSISTPAYGMTPAEMAYASDGPSTSGSHADTPRATASGAEVVPSTKGAPAVEYRDITLGSDPVGSTPEAAVANAKAAAEAAVADGRWSQQDADEFLKWLNANKQAYIEAVKSGKSVGPFNVVELRGDARNFAWMADGEKGGYDTQGNVRVPDGTKAVVASFTYTDASGKVHTLTIKSPIVCNNFGQAPGAESIVAPEAPAPKPKTPLGEFWGQLMCPDSTLAQYYLGFTITDFGDFDPTNWKASLHDTFMKYILPTIPAEYKPDYVLARIDLNHDGVPDQLVKIYIKDSFDVDASGNKVPVHAGDIRDWVVHPDQGPAINVSELPPDQRDAFLEANEKKNTIGYDPVATQEANNGHKGGPAQSTPNPVDRWVLGADGKLHPAFQTPAELADEYFRIFINGIFHTDNLPIELEKLLWPILDSQASEIKSMSVSEIVAKFHLTEDQAKELLAYIKGFGERAHLKPNAGETLQDYMKRCFTVVAEKSQK